MREIIASILDAHTELQTCSANARSTALQRLENAVAELQKRCRCPACRGQGEVRVPARDEQITCDGCEGRGWVLEGLPQ